MKYKNILILCLLLLSSSKLSAFVVNGINYTITSEDDLTAEVGSNSGFSGAAIIQSKVEQNGKTYTVTSIGERAFANCSGLTSVTIPNSVTSMGMGAFNGCYYLTSITISNNVTSIGPWAFAACSKLTSITIPSSVTSIGEYAFLNCNSLTSVHISDLEAWCKISFSDNPLSIAHHLYLDGKEITNLVIPNSVTSIGSRAFMDCSGLTSVTIPNSVTSIGSRAFKNCSSLTSITIPNSVTSIGADAFNRTGWYNSQLHGILYLDNWLIGYKGEGPTGELVISEGTRGIADEALRDCSSLTSITIPNSVTSIGRGAFQNCSGITLVKVPVTDYATFCENKIVGLINSNIGKPVQLIDKDGTIITEYVVPEGVTSIGSSVFRNCTGLTSVTIPDGLTSIGEYAFNGCSGITQVKVPVTDYSVFCKNKALGLIYSNIGKPVHLTNKDGVELTEYVVPEEVTSIGSSAFRNCTGLTTVTIPSNLTNIGSNAFSGCNGIKLVKVPVADCSAFCENKAVGLICSNIGKPIQLIDNDGAEITEYVVPNGVTSIGSSAFRNCTGLTSITIPGDLTSIGSYAFSGCNNINNVKVPVTDYASFCQNKAVGLIYSNIGKSIQLINKDGAEITEYVVPNGVTSIGSSVFRNCTGLTSVTIPNGVRSIEDAAFSGCSGLSSVDVPNSVLTIGGSAFQSCTGLTSITIPGGVTSMGNNAFTGCYGINLVKITVTDYASFCENKAVGLVYSNIGKPVQLIDNEGAEITEYLVPNGVTAIGSSTFRNCAGLTSVKIGSGVTSIGDLAFSGCSSLETVIAMPNIPPHIEDNTFPNAKDISLFVPMGRKTAYEAADVWRFFKEINEWVGTVFKAVTPQGIEMQFRVVDENEKTVETYAKAYEVGEDFVPCIDPETEGDLIIPAEIEGYRVVGIGSESFRECMGLTSASLPTGITYIGEGAFRLATSLKAVTIPEGVEEIRAHSFNGCPLKTVVLPSTLKYITGTYVFRNSNAKNETCSFIANMQRPSTLDENSIMGMEYYDLYVPKGRKEFYLSEPQWDKFRNIYEMGEVDDDVKDIVTAKNVTMKAGEKATLTVSLNTIGNADYNGYQFNLYLPEGISVATDENGNYLVTEKTGRRKVALPLDDGSMLFYTTADKNHAALASGTLMEIELTADSALAAGKYTVRIDRVVCATRDNESVSLPSSTATVTVEKAETDTQGVISADDVEGEPATQIKLPVFLNNTTDINAFYFDLTLPMGITVAKDKAGQFIASFTDDYADGKMLLSCLPWDPSMGTTNNVNTWRFIATPIDDNLFRANAGRVMNITLDVDKDMASGVYTARMNVVKLVEVVSNGSRSFGMMHAPANNGSWTSYSTITIRTNQHGDVNGDVSIDVADIATVIDVMAGGSGIATSLKQAADVNKDGTVDVADIAAIIDIMAANARRLKME